MVLLVHVSFELSLAVNTLGDWVVGERLSGWHVVVLVMELYLLSEKSYSPETLAGDLHALEELRANQVQSSAQKHHRHSQIHTQKQHIHTEKIKNHLQDADLKKKKLETDLMRMSMR